MLKWRKIPFSEFFVLLTRHHHVASDRHKIILFRKVIWRTIRSVGLKLEKIIYGSKIIFLNLESKFWLQYLKKLFSSIKWFFHISNLLNVRLGTYIINRENKVRLSYIMYYNIWNYKNFKNPLINLPNATFLVFSDKERHAAFFAKWRLNG